MRVISGMRKGISLASVPGNKTRPTTDRVKESIFNIIAPYLHGGKVLDLFAGAGALGIEALSRGADSAVFIDTSFPSIQCIKKNLKTTNFSTQAEVYKTDWKIAIDKLEARKERFDYIFLDPPYEEFQEKYSVIIEMLLQKKILQDRGIVVCEHDYKLVIPNPCEEELQKQTYKYGNTGVTVFHNREVQS